MKHRIAAVAAAVVALTPMGSVAWGGSSQSPLSEASRPTAPRSDGSVPKSPTGSYVVVMKGDPVIRSMSSRQMGSPAAKDRQRDLEASHDSALSKAGIAPSAKVHDYTSALNGFALTASHEAATRLAADPEVAVVLPDELRHPAADDSGPEAQGGQGAQDDPQGAQHSQGEARRGSLEVGQNGLYEFLGLTGRQDAWTNGVTGEGVTVGVIDTGIWPEHPSFADDGSYPAHEPLDGTTRSACAFGNTTANPQDAAYTCTNKLVGARVFLDTYKRQTGLKADEFDSARDDDGHGTHTASTAAGNAGVRATILGVDKGTTSGIAPRAQVIAYKALGNEGGYTSDLVAAIDQAVDDKVDVINYSIGGGAATVSADTIAFLFAANAGVFAAVSAGNSGPAPRTIGGPADVPWVTSVGANTHRSFFQGLVEAGGKLYPGASITLGTSRTRFVDAAAAGNELCLADSLDPAKVTGAIVLCKRGGNGRVAKSFEVKRAGGVGMVLYNAVDVDTLFSDTFFVPTVMVDYTPGVALKQWIASTRTPTGRLVNTGVGKSPFYSPTMAYFSSRGENPTAGDIIKPDVTAPGVQILAGNTPFPTPDEQVPGELFQAIAGTSMSSPVVAGSYALLKQQHRDWSPAMAKSALMTTAYTKVRDNDRTSPAGPFAMGAGMALVGKPGSRGSAFQPGLVYDAGIEQYLGFLCAEGPEVFGNPETTCRSLADNGVPTRAADLNLASIGVEAVAGSATVTRTVTSVADRRTTFVAELTPPPGYSVTVEPRRLTLRPGETASFTVTLTSDGSAPFGEWRTGSLTWRGGGYAVRSPIAVKGLELAAPATVTGTGTSGSLSVPVQFGFAGPYTATAEGLLAPTATSSSVAQDPDQTYPSADDGAGVRTLPFTLTGVGVARWTLDLPGATDLDLYLLGPDGTVVAQSTSGGTHELIELQAPADGTYTMVVHGWGVGATPVSFDLLSWLVPVDDGSGSLQIASGASAAATIGATHTVVVSWSGLQAGTSYLGAVTHRDGDRVIGRTVVSVTG